MMYDLISFHNDLESIGGDDASQQLANSAASPPQSISLAASTPGAAVNDSHLIDPVGNSAYGQEALTNLGTRTIMTASCQSSPFLQSIRGHDQRRTVTPCGVRLAEGPLIKQWADERLNQARMGHYDDPPPRRGHANFFVSHELEFTSDIIEAIHTELRRRRSDIEFEIRGRMASPYLFIDAPSEEVAVEFVRLAGTLADEMISDLTVHTTAVFLEPPAFPLDSVEVKLEYSPAFQATRPGMLLCTETFSNPNLQIKQDNAYMNQLCIQLSAALKRVGRVNSGFNLKVHLGHFFLISFPHSPSSGRQSQAQYKFDQFSSLVQNPRTIGKMNPQIGDFHKAVQVLRAIRRDGSPFNPQSFSIHSAAQVPPAFIFEGHSSQYRIEAHLQPAGNIRVDGEAGQFKVAFIQVFKSVDNGVAKEIDITTLSLGRKFDWKIETVNELPEDDSSLQGLKGELRLAKIQVAGRGDNLDDYPHMTFNNTERLSNQLNKVAIKSVYQFMYSTTYYVVEFTIRREWKNIKEMTSPGVEPSVTFGITVYGEHWGETRASEVAKTGRGWGEELEILFRDELVRGSANANGQSRVWTFVTTINAIRDALPVDL